MTGRHSGGRRPPARSTSEARGRRPRAERWRWVTRTATAALLLVLAMAGWLLWTGLRARSELNDARQATETLRTALVGGDSQTAQRALADATAHAAKAHALTSDMWWRLAGRVPYLGRTPTAVTEAAADVDRIAREVLPGLVEVGHALNPAALRHGSQIDVAALADAAPSVAAAAAALAAAQSTLAAIRLDGVAAPVANGVRAVQQQIAGVRGELDAAATATGLLPSMLGADTPRRYLVVFQNNAEARGTGGLVGAFAVLQATKGRLAVVRLGSDTELRSASAPVVDLGPAYKALFGTDPAMWVNTNVSAHFPSAAVQQLELWRRQFGERLDGVVALDPVTLGYLLTAAGPATLPGGEQVTGAAVADLTMRDVYARYSQPAQVPQRKAFLQVVAKAALESILGGAGSSKAELAALGRAAGERRLLVYSTHAAEESLLATTALGGVVDAAPGPYVGLAVDNASGSKIDYYLSQRLDYSLGACPTSGVTGTRASTVTVTLNDGAPPSGLPAYVAYRLDRGPLNSATGRGGDGSVRETVLVYASVGAGLTSATLDGEAVTVTPGLDGASPGRPVYVLSVVLAAGQTRTIVLKLREPSTSLPARGWVTPLVRPTLLVLPTVEVATCR